LGEAIIQEIRQELKKYIDQEYHDGAKRYIKEGITLHGVQTPIVRKISTKYFSRIKTEPKDNIFQLCEDLLKSDYSEERTIAFDWAFRLRKQYSASDFYIFELWLKKYVSNWGACDDLCVHTFGEFIFQFPEFLTKVKEWAKSSSRWLKRTSAVVLIYSLRRGKYLETAFEIADSLLLDDDYLVQNGYGWMLKVVSNSYPDEVFNYVMKHKAEMPRRALRYAIEKLSPGLKKKAMSKESI
jgi:3-methyladenine DNA glycosylase AlkD